MKTPMKIRCKIRTNAELMHIQNLNQNLFESTTIQNYNVKHDLRGLRHSVKLTKIKTFKTTENFVKIHNRTYLKCENYSNVEVELLLQVKNNQKSCQNNRLRERVC